MKTNFSKKLLVVCASALLFMTDFTSICFAQNEKIVWLDELQVRRMTTGWGRPQAKKSIDGNPLKLDGKVFDRGVGTHSNSTFTLLLDGNVNNFQAVVGIDDEVGSNPQASVEFKLIGDDKVLWQSGIMKSDTPAKEVKVDLKGVKKFILEVTDAGDGFNYDHSDWADARFEITGAKPVSESVLYPFEPDPYLAKLAPTPPMGWNSWDCYGPTIREDEVKSNADYMAEKLAKHGWKYIVVDIQWSEPNAKPHGYRPFAKLTMDEYGRLIPAPNRFPSSADGAGFKNLSGYVHSKGLKFGIHIMRGIPRQAVAANTPVLGTSYRAKDVADINSTCSWLTDMYGVNMKHPGGQAYYDSIAKLYAEWGVDYIKADDMASPYHADEIEGLSKALRKCGREIVLSLSPGPAPVDKVAHLVKCANLWRITGDFWDNWGALRHTFDVCEKWYPYIGPGHWPDADMLALGRIGIRAEVGDDRKTNFTKDEQITLMTLWSIFRSPLMFGGDLPSNDDFTLSLLTNDEVLAVNQNSAANKELFFDGDKAAWIADVPNSNDKYLALFNVGDITEPVDISVTLSQLGFKGKCQVRDLWQHKTIGTFEETFSAKINKHSAGLYRLTGL